MPTDDVVFNQTNRDVELSRLLNERNKADVHRQIARRFVESHRRLNLKRLLFGEGSGNGCIDLVDIQCVAIGQRYVINREQRIGIVIVVPRSPLLCEEIRKLTRRLGQTTGMDTHYKHAIFTQLVLERMSCFGGSRTIDATRAREVLNEYRFVTTLNVTATSGIDRLKGIVGIDFVATHQGYQQGCHYSDNRCFFHCRLFLECC